MHIGSYIKVFVSDITQLSQQQQTDCWPKQAVQSMLSHKLWDTQTTYFNYKQRLQYKSSLWVGMTTSVIKWFYRERHTVRYTFYFHKIVRTHIVSHSSMCCLSVSTAVLKRRNKSYKQYFTFTTINNHTINTRPLACCVKFWKQFWTD